MHRRESCGARTRDPAGVAVGKLQRQGVGLGLAVRIWFDGADRRGRRAGRRDGRRVVVAGLLRTRRDTSSGDPWTTGAKHPPNSRDGARCGALKAAAHAHGRAVGAVPSCRPAKMVAYFWCPTFLGQCPTSHLKLHFSPPPSPGSTSPPNKRVFSDFYAVSDHINTSLTNLEVQVSAALTASNTPSVNNYMRYTHN